MTKAAITAREIQETMQFREKQLFDDLRLMELLLKNLKQRAPVYLEDLVSNCNETFERIEQALSDYR